MGVKLENLKRGERVDIVIRRHWIAFVLIGVYFVMAVLFSGILLGLLGLSTGTFLLLCVFWMYYAMFLYINWLNYELDLFIFTNNRVVCVEQVSFLNRSVGETTLDKVQEVGIETKGLFANLLDYGTMRIMTAGASPSFDMTFSPKPLKNSRYINNLVDKYRDNLYGGNNRSRGGRKHSDPSMQVDSILQEGKK